MQDNKKKLVTAILMVIGAILFSAYAVYIIFTTIKPSTHETQPGSSPTQTGGKTEAKESQVGQEATQASDSQKN